MSGSNRNEGFKALLIGLAVVFGFAIGASVILWGLSQKAEYEREANDRYKEYASHTYYPQRYSCFSPTVFNQIDCIAKHEADAREYQRGEQDLVSQRVTALWTVLMGGAAITGMMSSVIGIILIWTTFKATKEQVAIMRNEQRPIIAFEKLKYSAFGDNILAYPVVKNMGKAPARITKALFQRVYGSLQYTKETLEILKRSNNATKIDASLIIPADGAGHEIGIGPYLLKSELMHHGMLITAMPPIEDEMYLAAPNCSQDAAFFWLRIDYEYAITPDNSMPEQFFTELAVCATRNGGEGFIVKESPIGGHHRMK